MNTIIQTYRGLLRCDHYGCINTGRYVIGNPGGPRNVTYIICEDHLKLVITEGNALFPELAGLDARTQAAEAIAQAVIKDLELASKAFEEEKAELEAKLTRAFIVIEKKQAAIDGLEAAVIKNAVEKSRENPQTLKAEKEPEPTKTPETPETPKPEPTKTAAAPEGKKEAPAAKPKPGGSKGGKKKG